MRDYAAIFVNPRFQRLAAASAFNFAALWVYIASAPAFVLDLLRLDGRRLTEPVRLVLRADDRRHGARRVRVGRAAGRISGERLVRIGFACSALAMARATWATPCCRRRCGAVRRYCRSRSTRSASLVFPIVTLAILDMYPHQRGSASSSQAFTSLVLNALVAGVLSPVISAGRFGWWSPRRSWRPHG
jgi:DHA1 family bicyclomycin/chloramphenicol resistance-like MFS transporter